jgi:hypothetical protein
MLQAVVGQSMNPERVHRYATEPTVERRLPETSAVD